jgi:polar amino acid transport system substrate-binding protein
MKLTYFIPFLNFALVIFVASYFQESLAQMNVAKSARPVLRIIAPSGSSSKWEFKGTADYLSSPGRVGLIPGYSYGNEVDDLIKKNPSHFETIYGDSSLKRVLKLLTTGRISTFPEDAYMVDYYLKQNNITNIRRAGCQEEVLKGTLAASPKFKGAKELVEKYSAELKSMRSNGRVDQIFEEFGISNWLEQKNRKISVPSP